MNINLTWLLSKYIHRKDWLSFLKLNTTFYEFGSLLSSGINPSIYHNETIKRAARKGYIKVVELLLKDPRIKLYAYNVAIRYAVVNGYDEIVEILLKDPRVKISPWFIDIKNFLKDGYEKAIELLLQDPRVDPSISHNDTI